MQSIPTPLRHGAITTLLATMLLVPTYSYGETLTDPAITDAVESEIMLDGTVSLNDIDITTREGVVSLTGDVDNILARERAARLASTVKGTRSVINQLQVEPVPARKDEQIQRNIEDALLRDPATDSYEVDVAVEDGIATLSGTVDSWQEKTLTAQVAKGQQGVTALNNNIGIDYYSSERPDEEIQQDARQALAWNALIDDGLIDVNVTEGTVILEGTVASAAEKIRAQSAAWVSGATSVDTSDLTVARWTRDAELRENSYVSHEPEAIRDALEDAFLYDPRVKAFKIESHIDGSVATLRGTVDNLKAKRAAEQAARYTTGITSVRNFIKVRPDSQLDDQTVAQHIAEAFGRDPLVNRYEIDVSVLNGTAYLYGEVDSYLERGQADDIASRESGVSDVRNLLTVRDRDDPYYTNPYVNPWTWYNYDWRDFTPAHTLREDTRIEEDIESQFFWSPFVDGEDIEVTVDDGEAQLTGTVSSWTEREAATENAFEGGATWVDNDLKVETS